MSAKRIMKRTLDTRRAGQTDWERVDSLTEEQIEANAAADEENGQWTEEQLKVALEALYMRIQPNTQQDFFLISAD